MGIRLSTGQGASSSGAAAAPADEFFIVSSIDLVKGMMVLAAD
jgi:hypothetical protein